MERKLYKDVRIYDWFAIQDELCKIMGIDKDDFRARRKPTGEWSTDYWHIAIDHLFPNNMSNDSIVTMYPCITDHIDNPEVNKLVSAWNTFLEENGLTGQADTRGILVEFSW